MFSLRFLPIFFAMGALLGLASPAEAATPQAQKLFDVFGFPVTNSMVTSWVIALLIIVAVRWAVKQPKLVPSRGQAMVEAFLEAINDITAPILGKRVAVAAFPLLATFFLYILIQNWSGLLPGVGTIGWGVEEDGHFTIVRELIRPGHADLNSTLALAVVAMVAWLYFIFRYAGIKVIAHDLFGNKADRAEVPLVIFLFLSLIFILVGFIEIISIIFRPISLSFRLFGNIFGGENLLHGMIHLFPWGLPIPFYVLELIIGLVQALVFTLLVAVYIGLICNHGDEEHEEGAAH